MEWSAHSATSRNPQGSDHGARCQGRIGRPICHSDAGYDNALMETINGPDKAERIRSMVFHEVPHRTIADLEFRTPGRVDWYRTLLCSSTKVQASGSMSYVIHVVRVAYRSYLPRAR